MSPKTLWAAAAGLGCVSLLTFALGAALFIPALSHARGGKPTAADVEKALHAIWDKNGDAIHQRVHIDVNSVQIGDSYPANEQDVVDGIPPGAKVTAALVDFTVHNYYKDVTESVRMQREAKVYVDKFGQWQVMTGQSRGEDVTTREPAHN